MSKLRVSIGPARTPTGSISPLYVMVGYIREIASSDDDQIITAPAVGTFSLPRNLVGEYEILDYSASTPIELSISTEQGNRLLVSQDIMPSSPAESSGFFTFVRRLTSQEIDSIIKATTPSEPSTTRMLHRNGKFVTLGGMLPNPREYTLLVSAIKKTTIPSELLKSLFGLTEFGTIAKEIAEDDRPALSRMQLGHVQKITLQLQGEFKFTIPIEGTEAGWVWLLASASNSFIGIQQEESLDRNPRTVTIFLPFSISEGTPPAPMNECQCGAGRPIDATESELVDNPEKFSDDPGQFCKPFVNPHRIVGEKSFFTILRVTQPAIGGESSYPKPETLPPFPFSPTLTADAATESAGIIRETTPSGITVITRTDTAREGSTSSGAETVADGIARSRAAPSLADMVGFALESAKAPSIATKAAILQRRPYVVAKSRGRQELSGSNPLEWEGDSTIYQAQSLAFGHILEFRVRWRSNGYSLGNIAHTLTLAPRQTRKIITVQSKILDEARRREVVQSKDSVAQETSRNYSYVDAVESGLSEWSKGGSKSSSTAGSLGFGFAAPGFVIGGGGSHGSSQSTSWMNGGRNIAASEEQSLRDSIRQYGESLRKLESMVIVEQSQEEITQAVSEIVRNPNYCHSLTIVYHEILKHLRIDTEVVGARECVFVPLPILPFTVERALRWRDILQQNIHKQELRWALEYLDEVATNFASSNIPPGPRSSQAIKHLTGSIYLQLAIERPKENSDGTFNPDAWSPLAKYLIAPPISVFDILKKTVNQMDALFQREYAPSIAARWVNTLKFESDVRFDFTLATKYNYNQSVRIDFTASGQASLTRAGLQKLVLRATEKLPPGSVANVKKIDLHYYTDAFDYRVSSAPSTDDLISIATGEPSGEMAELYLPLTDWEKQDMQREIREAVARLITHLNEHVEFYTKAILWGLDRDKLWMMLDGIYVRGKDDGRSVASVVEREPVAILGNSLVYRVASGAFLGIDDHKTPEDLNKYYSDSANRAEPIRVSLPTSGLYAQSLMDECEACEEHFGSTEWVLNDKEPELAELVPDMLRSRRADVPPNLTPSQLPNTIINLQNPANVPSPSGFTDILNAIQNPNAFRDMTGLAGTQANAAAALSAAANMATQFSSQAAALKIADLTSKAKATQDANRKLAAVKKAKDSELISTQEVTDHTNKILNDMHTTEGGEEQTETLDTLAQQILDQGGSGTVAQSGATGTRVIDIKPAEFQSYGSTTSQPSIVLNMNQGSTSKGRVAIFSFGTFKETNRFKAESFGKGFFDTDVLFNSDPTELIHKDGVGLVQMAGSESVFTLFRTEPDDDTNANKQRTKSQKLWKKTMTDGETYKGKFKAWIDSALQDDIDCLYLTGHHWTPTSTRFNLSNGVFGNSFRIAGELGKDKFNIGYSGTQDLEFDVASIRNSCKLIFGFGCDLATKDASTVYQDVFGRGDGDVPVICGWNTTVGLPAWNQADRSPNVRYFEYLQDFANANIDPNNRPANLLQWFYDNHPMELVRAWGHATQRWIKGAARARGKDGKLYKFKLEAGQIKEVETSS